MAKRPTLTDLMSLTNSSGVNAINTNWDEILEAFDNTLSLDGSVPNAMGADLDLNGNALLNVGTIDVTNLTLDGQTITDLATVPEWRSSWLTATSYAKNDLVKTAGNVYICLVSHTSGTFSTDITALKWELMVTKGDSGAGTGDLLAANDLSDLANAVTARSNLLLGTVATESTVPISKGGTGSTDAASAVAALGAQPLGSTLTSLEALSLVSGDMLYATAADTIVRLPKNTNGQLLSLASGLPAWTTVGAPVLLASKTASASATLNFTELVNATYSRYLFVLKAVKPTTDAVILQMQFSTDGGATYLAAAGSYSFAVETRNHGGGNDDGGSSSATALSITTTNGVGAIGNAAGEDGVSGEVVVMNAASASLKTVVRTNLSAWNTTTQLSVIDGSGAQLAAADTDAIRFLFSSGTIASGTIEMWGLT